MLQYICQVNKKIKNMPKLDDIAIEQKPERIVHVPHDSAFKIAFNELRVAHDFIVRYVPKEILDRVDLTTLRRCSENFVDRALHQTEADVIYCAHLKRENNASEIEMLYSIIEHQSTPDRSSPLRSYNYGFRTIDAHRREYPKSKILPMIVVIILYNGKRLYPYSTFLSDLFGSQKELAAKFFVGVFQPILVDLTVIENEEIKTHGWSGLIEFVLKNAGLMDAFEILKEAWFPLIKPLPEDSDYTAGMVKYIISQGDIENVPAFLEKVRTLFSPVIEEKIMGFVEYFTQKGLEQGVQQGVQQGRQEMIRILLKNLNNDKTKVIQLTGLTDEKIEELLKDSN